MDLALLVADNNIREAVLGILGRAESIGIGKVKCEAVVHPNRDPGCYHTGHELLISYVKACAHALVLFDRAWEGAPSPDPRVLAADVEEKLKPAWGNRARCIVIDPEVEVWIWSDSPHVATALGWTGRSPDLHSWLSQRGLWHPGQAKPSDPKRALNAALREVRLPASSAIFAQVARTASLQRCTDTSFNTLLQILRSWFEVPNQGRSRRARSV